MAQVGSLGNAAVAAAVAGTLHICLAVRQNRLMDGCTHIIQAGKQVCQPASQQSRCQQRAALVLALVHDRWHVGAAAHAGATAAGYQVSASPQAPAFFFQTLGLRAYAAQRLQALPEAAPGVEQRYSRQRPPDIKARPVVTGFAIR